MNARRLVIGIVVVVAVALIVAAIAHRARGTALSRCGFKSNIATFQTIDDMAAFESSNGSRGLGEAVRVELEDVGVTFTPRGDSAIDLRIEPRDVPALSSWSNRALDKSARISVDELQVSIARVTGVFGAHVMIPVEKGAAQSLPGQLAIVKALDLEPPK